MGGQRVHLAQLLEDALRHVGAIRPLQIGSEGHAVLLGIGGDGVDIGLHLLLHVVIKGHALGLGLFAHQVDAGQVALGGILQILIPGDILLGVDLQQHLGHGVHGLSLHGFAGVDTHVAAVVGAGHAVQGGVVEVIHLSGGKVLSVHRQRDGAALEDAGIIQQHHSGHDHEQDGHAAVDQLIFLALGRFLLLPLDARIYMALSGQLLAVFLFSGCTHLFSVLSSDRHNTPLVVKYLTIIP